jgi:hypothetical protein
VTRPGVNEEERGRGAGVGGRGRGLQKNDDENFSYCPLSRELHLIQIIHGNFPPHQSDQAKGQRGREGWGCWSGGEGGFRRMMTRIFRIVPCQGVLGKERGVFKAAGDRLRKFFVLNERKRKFSAAFIEFETLCCAIFCSLM